MGFEQFMSEYGVHVWIIIGILFGIAEVVTVSFFALPFGLGGFCAAIAAGMGMSFNAQLGIFAGSSFVMLFVIQIAVRKYFSSDESDKIKTNSDALVGETARVMEPIKGSYERGSVKIGGEVWTAICADELSFEPDQPVKILAVQGAKLLVGPIDVVAAPVESEL